MIDKKFLAGIRKLHAAYASARREVVGRAAAAQNAAKRAIFALHRDDLASAETLLDQATEALAKVAAAAKKHEGLRGEGSYRAALEEYVEAALLRDFQTRGKIGKVAAADIDDEIYLGGLADVTGELQRRQVRLAAARRFDEAGKIKAAIEEIVGLMLEMDLTGYLRTKFDQAKNNLRRAEEVEYEISLRQG